MLWDFLQVACAIFAFWVLGALVNSGLESLYWWYQDKKAETKNGGSGDQ